MLNARIVGKLTILDISMAVSQKRFEVGIKLLQNINRKSTMSCLLALSVMTLTVPERLLQCITDISGYKSVTY